MSESLNTGAKMNEMIKMGAIDASEKARKTLRYIVKERVKIERILFLSFKCF